MAKGLPETRRDMRNAGYVFKDTSKCKGCGASIEWWLTTNKKSMPFNADVSEHMKMVVHWSTCPNRDDFRSDRPVAAPAALPPVDRNAAELDRLMRQIAELTQCRVMTVVTDDGPVSIFRLGLSGEDLRSDLIAAGNRVRSDVAKGAPR